MAMVPNGEFTLLNELRPYKTYWKVEVKVLDSWTQHSNYPGGDTLEFLLEDKMGFVIQCTCKRLFHDRVKKLQVGKWRFLEYFQVHIATGIYRRTNAKFKISITGNSIVTNPYLNTSEIIFTDHDNQYSSEDVSTSFSKRKERDDDLDDMNSTSKRLCDKNIKMEMLKTDYEC